MFVHVAHSERTNAGGFFRSPSSQYLVNFKVEFNEFERRALESENVWEQDALSVLDAVELQRVTRLSNNSIKYAPDTFTDLTPVANDVNAPLYAITYRQLLDFTCVLYTAKDAKDCEYELRKNISKHVGVMLDFWEREYRRKNPPAPFIPQAVESEPEPEPEPLESTIADRTWFSHCLLLAQPGAGKTNAIRWRIMQLVPHIREGRTSLVILDPKGVLTHEMLTLARTYGLEKRTIFIDPERAPVSVNLFANDGTVNETINRISRVFATISTDLTAMQRDTLTFTLRALFAQPYTPSLGALRTILRQGKKSLQMDALPSVVKEFFEFDFKEADGTFILRRLNSFLANPIFEMLFDSERPSFDIGKEMQSGKLIVINAGNAESLYGRFWIEQIDRTIRPRLALAENRRTPTFVIIDEADTFIAEDRHFADILDRAREARIGMLIAAQHMGQIKDDHVTNSLYNSALKFVARTNADIHNLCRSMGTTETDFLGTIPQYHFAFFGPNMQSAALVKLPLVEFARARKEDIDFFTHRHTTPTPPAEPETPHEVSIEELGLADAYAQLALAIRRGNTKRAAELQDHINSQTERTQRRSEGSSDWR